MKLAFYGKGGIGKSTIAANVSAAYAMAGKKVLHIGCDPKADSTRSLMQKRIPTVLEKIEEKGSGLQRDDIIYKGRYGVSCVEAGGPQAGVGCAGLGISAAMKELERLGILAENWDLVLYDVLGDVVCGGFSVPMRQHYVDQVMIVTSADYMSLYAANNILKGALHYSSKERCLVSGIILNHVRSEQERQIGQLFAAQTGTKLLAVLKESKEMRIADYQGTMLGELFPKSENMEQIRKILSAIEENSAESAQMVSKKALTQEEMETLRTVILEKGWV